jgi:hypothetical protein
MKTSIPPVLITISLVCFGLLPKARAVVPPPDGGYPGFNTAEGQSALFSLTTGTANTAVGWFSLHSNTDGSFNTAVGAGALISPTSAARNTAIGAAALLSDTTGALNTAVGTLALFSNDVGGENTAVGDSALFGNISGTFNTVNGQAALFSNTIGSANTAVGSAALLNNIDGDFNTAVGGNALAEEVAEANPDLVVRDENGQIYTVRYDAVNAMLLNEFLKEHRKVETLEATVAQQHKDFEAAITELKGQIQKVSAQLEASKPAPQVVSNP